MGAKLERYTVIERKEDDSYVFRLSDESVDRHGTVLLSRSWGEGIENAQPIVLWMHKGASEDADYVLGRGEVWREGKELYCRVIWEEDNDFAMKIKGKVDFGSIRSVSVGFIPYKGHWGEESRGEDSEVYYFDEVELLEFSIVDIPSNKNANKRAFEDFLKDQKPEDIQEEINTDKRSLSHFRARANFLNLK